uniref:Uncharacterized protein n=1 Tax=Vespula pensylvanica TaxID=30213 RepID=A0A834P4H6_VESPE|nr:hypothetical protein H0235_007309 [Vespula pensylvanica]
MSTKPHFLLTMIITTSVFLCTSMNEHRNSHRMSFLHILNWQSSATCDVIFVGPLIDFKDYYLKKINEAFTGSNDKVNDTEEISSKTVNKVVATLKGHCNKIVGLGWSPDLSGYLQELIITFVDHCRSVCCRMWNPLDPDLIITGSIDFTLHLWRISTQFYCLKKRIVRKVMNKISKSTTIKAGANSEAASLLAHRKDVESLTIAIKLTSDYHLFLDL